jgi:hypothetical protein
MWLLIASLFAQFSGGTGVSPVPPFCFHDPSMITAQTKEFIDGNG